MERGTQGDSFAVIFREGPSAVAAAADAQRALARHGWPPRATVRVRIGLHTGLGLAGGDDYVGVDIHRAARIAGLANGGQTLLSDSTRSLVERDLPPGTELRDLGTHRLRDLAHPERLFELVIDGASPAAGLRAEAAPGNLPPPLSTLVGRDRELAEIERHLEAGPLVTVSGPGGIGKTSLAVALARRVADRFPDGAWLVRLDAVTDPALVDATIADALGLRDAGGRPPKERLEDFLRDAALLLVLDNLEQLPGVSPRIVELLQLAPRLRVVATSRAPLGVSVEQLYPVPPLALEPEDASPPDAVRLFTQRARRARPDYAPDAAEQAAIAAICRRVDGLPLGIELAAAQIRLLPARTILERLDRSLDLPAGPTDLPTRHRSLRDTVAWSYDLLDPAAQGALARLSVMVGGARLEEAETIARSGPATDPDMLAVLATLTDHSLLMPRRGVDGPRFAMLDTIRSFAAERLDASGERGDARRRHALAYLALAEGEARHLPGRDQAVRLVRLTEDHDNLRATAAWAIEAGEADVALRLAAAMWRFWQLRGHVAEGLAVTEALLAIPGAARDDALRLRAVEAYGGLLYWHGDMTAARAAYEEQVRIGRAIEDRRGLADGLFNLAHTLSVALEAGPSQEALTEAGRLYEELGDERGVTRVAWATSQGGLMSGGDPIPLGVASIEALIDLHQRFEKLDDFLYAELCLGGLAWIHLALGNMREAAHWGGRAMRTSWEAGSVSDTTFSLRAAAIVATAVESWQEAVTLVGAYEEYERRFAVRPPLILEVIVERENPRTLARQHLDAAAFETAVQAGRSMTFDEAVDYALGVVDGIARQE